jgi:peptidoglycan hydrolase-like protein with peptidoglycan-binding domain
MTAACALALGLAWSTAPAIAQDTTKDKAERKADQIENKAEKQADKIESQADKKASDVRAKGDREADKVRATTDGKSDSMGDKMDRAWDKTKAKTGEMKDKVTGNGTASADVRAAQQALKDQGFNPGPIDGIKGPRTTEAVRDFQEKKNLTVTGQLDAETRNQLMAAAPPAASPSTETNQKRQKQ